MAQLTNEINILRLVHKPISVHESKLLHILIEKGNIKGNERNARQSNMVFFLFKKSILTQTSLQHK